MRNDAKLAITGLVIAFIVIPAALGAVSSTDWWQEIEAETQRLHDLAEATYDPIPD